jgi:hypothetical protein
MKKTAVSIVMRYAKAKKGAVNPYLLNKITNITAVSSSTSGYLREIRSPQCLHLPLRKTKLKTGNRSGADSLFPQAVHDDGGLIIDLRSGIRYMRTFTNDPTTSPRMKTYT